MATKQLDALEQLRETSRKKMTVSPFNGETLDGRGLKESDKRK